MEAAIGEKKSPPAGGARAAPGGAGAPLLLLTEHFLPSTGGTIRWLENLARRYEGGPVAVLARATEGCEMLDPALPFRMERVPFRAFPYLRPESLVNYARLFGRARRLARETRPAVVVAARAVPEGLVAWLLRRLTGVPYVVFAHGEEISVPVAERRRHGTRLAKFLAMRRVYAGAARVLANSAYTVGLLRGFGHEAGNVRVHHPGVDTERFRPEGENLRGRLGLGGRSVLLTVGALMERKGQGAVVAAMPSLLRRFPEAVYLVSGAGPAERGIREAARALGVERAVRLLGRVSEEDLPALYRTADVFVLANRRPADSDLEGFGIAYLEAAASGLPVVAGLAGGNRDALLEGRSALRVDPEDPEGVAAVLARLLSDRDLARRLGEAGRGFVRASFAWGPLAREWNRLLREVREEVPGKGAEPERDCPVCGALRRPRVADLQGRRLLECPECGLGAFEGEIAPGEPIGSLRRLFEERPSGEPVELAGMPNLRALKWGFLLPRELGEFPESPWLLTPASLRAALSRAGFVGVEVTTRGAAWTRLLRRRFPLLDARDGLEAFFRSESGPPAPERPGRPSLPGRIADALGLGPVLVARARRP